MKKRGTIKLRSINVNGKQGVPYDSVTDQSKDVLKISVESCSTVTFETCKVVLSAQFRHILCLNQ